MAFRCVHCGRRNVPDSEGGDDELDRIFRQPNAGDDNGLCADCWWTLDQALTALVPALFGWLGFGEEHGWQ